jgi:hypothetical protein
MPLFRGARMCKFSRKSSILRCHLGYGMISGIGPSGRGRRILEMGRLAREEDGSVLEMEAPAGARAESSTEWKKKKMKKKKKQVPRWGGGRVLEERILEPPRMSISPFRMHLCRFNNPSKLAARVLAPPFKVGHNYSPGSYANTERSLGQCVSRVHVSLYIDA